MNIKVIREGDRYSVDCFPKPGEMFFLKDWNSGAIDLNIPYWENFHAMGNLHIEHPRSIMFANTRGIEILKRMPKFYLDPIA